MTSVSGYLPYISILISICGLILTIKRDLIEEFAIRRRRVSFILRSKFIKNYIKEINKKVALSEKIAILAVLIGLTFAVLSWYYVPILRYYLRLQSSESMQLLLYSISIIIIIFIFLCIFTPAKYKSIIFKIWVFFILLLYGAIIGILTLVFEPQNTQLLSVLTFLTLILVFFGHIISETIRREAFEFVSNEHIHKFRASAPYVRLGIRGTVVEGFMWSFTRNYFNELILKKDGEIQVHLKDIDWIEIIEKDDPTYPSQLLEKILKKTGKKVENQAYDSKKANKEKSTVEEEKEDKQTQED